ncbi:MAG: threonylcarbamoyl-AMP synthase [Rhodothermales bacterium]|nr:threonylcarbamoyl-AMP synthase [Rhodothermales bacterium]
MRTTLTSSCEEAAAFIRRGELAAFPTETVYGLGADALDVTAVKRIFEVKGRPTDNPMIVHLANADDIQSVVREISRAAGLLVSAFVPGPLTLVLEKASIIPMEVTAGLTTVGVRVPAHPVAHEFLSACGRPVAAPSANRSGAPSPTTWESVREDLDGLVPCILKGDRSAVGLESTVVDCTGSTPMILREGAIGLDMLRTIVPGVQPSSTSGGRTERSPGLRHRHYAPEARVRLYDPDAPVPAESSAYIGVSRPLAEAGFEIVMICRDVDHYAHELFHFFRECDRKGVRRIYCQRPPASGIGAALLDRIVRAGEPASRKG